MNLTVSNLPYATQHTAPVSAVIASELEDLPECKKWVRHSSSIRAGSLPAGVSCLSWSTYRYGSSYADHHIVYRRANGLRGVCHDIYRVVDDVRCMPEVRRYVEED